MRDRGMVEEYVRVKTALGRRESESIGYYGEVENGILKKILAEASLAPEGVEEIAGVNVMPPLK